MGCIPLVVLLSIGLSSGLNETSTIEDVTEQRLANATARRGRHIEEIIELPPPDSKKIKRQIIKIPPNVSKVKLVQPPLNLRQNRAPQQFTRYPSNFRSGGSWSQANKKSSDVEAATPYPFDSIKVKRKHPVKEVGVSSFTPDEYYRDEDYDHEERQQWNLKKHRQPHKVVKIKRKKPKQNVLSEYLVNYESDGSQDGDERGSKHRYEEHQSYYSQDLAGSSIHMKQIPPPNLYGQKPYSMINSSSFQQYYDEKHGTGMNIKKLPMKGRQVQSMFSQQYTTHNPHVTTNFGLGEVAQVGGVQYGLRGSFVEASPFQYSHVGKYNPVGAASDHAVTSLPAKTPGIQVIQPPQFRDVTVSHPSHPSRLMSSLSQQSEETSSQRATIRDILEQDCPSFDAKGYCDSPPRYPMQQIKNMVKKCASVMEAMNTQPYEEPHEVYGFSKRSDSIEERGNKSVSSDLETDGSSTWSRSSNDGLTACISDIELTEPGYAKEANSGRWFVIVQHPDTTIQRIATDTCRTPGKSCGGLSEMKCSKMNNLITKSTRCVQRHTYQRLISWDPETPDECPRMRVFRFPSACICHLGVI